MSHSSKNNNLIFAHGETLDPVVVCASAELSMFLLLLCGDDGGGAQTVSYFPVQLKSWCFPLRLHQ